MPSERRFSEVSQLLESAGYELVRIRGSHHLFVKPGRPLLSIPVHRGKVKPFYVQQIEKILKQKD